ncbi:MAG: hypothetical protein GC131_09575 [Alphaproteobacteria bacterium]|nr:hypothetical protein [Alphaproteobacteria bacterium]
MKILFYVEPWIEKNHPSWKTGWITGVLLDMAHQLNHAGGHSVFFLMGDAQDECEPELQKAGCTSAIISQTELRQIHNDYLQASLEWHQGTYKPETMAAMQSLVRKKLNGFEPDIIMSFIMAVPFLRDMFPGALTLVQETAIFAYGAKPYPTTWYFDPMGSFQNSFFRKYGVEAAGELPEEGRKFLALFRKKFLDRILRKKTPYTRAQLIGGRKVDYLLLLPLQQGQYFLLNGCSRYAAPWDIVCDVLDRAGPRIGVVVTEHVHWHEDSIARHNALTYLRRRYPNFIYLEDFACWENVSHLLLPHIDAVASVSSTVALNALLWQKPVVALGDSQLNGVADLADIEQLAGYLDAKRYRHKDNVLYFLLTRYAFMDEYVRKSQRLIGILQTLLDTWRKAGVTKDFYAQTYDTPWRLLKAYFRAADANVPKPYVDSVQGRILELEKHIDAQHHQILGLEERIRYIYASDIWKAGKVMFYLTRPRELLGFLMRRLKRL